MFEYDRLALDITQQFFTSMSSNEQRYYYHQNKQQQQPYYDSIKNGEINYNHYINNKKIIDDLFSNAQKIKTTTSQTSSKVISPTNTTNLINNVGNNGYYIQQKQLTKLIDNNDELNRRSNGISNLYGDCIFDCGASSGYGSPGVAGTPLTSPAPNSAHYIAHQLQTIIDQEFNETMINSNQFSLSLNDTTLNHLALKSNNGILTPKIQVASNLSSNLPIQNTIDSLENICNLNDDLAWKKLCLDDNNDDDFFDQQTTNADELLIEVNKNNSNNNFFEIDNNNNKNIFGRTIPSSTMITTSSTPETTTSSATTIAAAVEDGFSANEIAQFAQLLCSPKKAPPQRYQCHICYQTGHYISDCPMRFNSPYEELTPYQGRKKCYGEFQCQLCKRKWTSQNSVANEAQSCIKCHVPVFPHKQLPVDKAIALGLVKIQRILPNKIAPIGHGRPTPLENNDNNAMTFDFAFF